jgi:hypothetical protein
VRLVHHPAALLAVAACLVASHDDQMIAADRVLVLTAGRPVPW